MRVRARPLEFYTFCCHKCHTSFASCWKIGDYLYFIHLLRKRRAFPFNNRGKNEKSVDRKRKWWWCSANCLIIWESTLWVWIFRKCVHVSSWTCAYFLLFSAYSSGKYSVFPLQNDVLFYHKRRVVSLKMNMCFWGCCDTCDSKKTKKTVGCARVMRVYVCVVRGDDWLGIIGWFCCVYMTKVLISNLGTAFFCRFSTLLPHIYPYSIGRENIRRRIWNKVGMQSKKPILKRNSERNIPFSTLLLRSFLEVRWKLHFNPPFFLKNCFVRMK